ncbi:unnamed protein product, partial [Owenia fusiformis]
ANMSSDIQIGQLPLTWIRKILTLFERFDRDKDGVNKREDLLLYADKVIREGTLTDEASCGIYKFFQNYFDVEAAQDIHNKTSVAEKLISVWKYKDVSEIVEWWLKMFLTIFEACNLDSTGLMPFDSFMVFWNSIDADKRFARMQFDFLDTDGDGFISKEEFSNGFVHYMSNTDENTLNRFVGPLINY